MLLSDFLSIIFIPSLIQQNTSKETNEDPDFVQLSGIPDIVESKSTSRHGIVGDPLLKEIYDEADRLRLSDYPDDFFDHLENGSEEARKLVKSRQKAATSSAPPSAIVNVKPTTEYPILQPQVTETTTTTTKKPGIFGSVWRGVKDVGRSITGVIKPTTTTTTTVPPPEEMTLPCSKQAEVYFKGECRNILTNSGCDNSNHWLIEDPATLRLICVPNNCSWKGQTAYFGGKCVKVGSPTFKEDNGTLTQLCHEGMTTYIFRSGIVQCDCKPGHLFHEADSKCYKAFSQGPCTKGNHFRIGQGQRKPECLPNPCGEANLFCNAPRCPRKRNCVAVGSSCGDLGGQYEIHPTYFTPTCVIQSKDASQAIIGNVPTLSCAPGSRRDILGNCRTPTTIDFS